MKSLVVKVLSLLCFVCICFAFASCEDKTEYDKLRDEGNFITVTYNPNGGRISTKKGISYIDMFNPETLKTSADGSIHIKLLAMDSPLRSKQNIMPSVSGYFCAGWYRTRTPVTKIVEDVEYVVDEAGNLLTLNADEEYVIAKTIKEDGTYADATGKERTSTPLYTYSDRWDFDKDELVYEGGSKKLGIYNGATGETQYTDGANKFEITLYAAWLKNFTFEYYYEETSGSETKWVKGGTSNGFDYVSVKGGKEGYENADEVYLPYWNTNEAGEKTGGLVYSSKNDAKQTISKKIGTTFYKAYKDEACTEEITSEKIIHSGSVDFATATAVNGIEKIYVKTTSGEDYYVDTLEQLTENASLNANYYVRNDLTFTKANGWPTIFTSGEFNGKIISLKGDGVTFNGIDVTVSSTENGGLFGKLGANAEINGVDFNNVNVYLSKTAGKGKYGMFAGVVAEGAKLTSVTVSGSFSLNGETETVTTGANAATFNLYANAERLSDLDGLTKGEVKLYVCGAKNVGNTYRYNIKTGTVSVNENYGFTYDWSIGTESKELEKSLEYPKA